MTYTYGLVRNAYFKEVAFRMAVFKKRQPVSGNVTLIMASITGLTEQHLTGKLTEEALVARLKDTVNKQRARQTPGIRALLQTDPLLRDVRYYSRINAVLVAHGKRSDTLYNANAGNPVMAFGDMVDSPNNDITPVSADTIHSYVSGDGGYAGSHGSFTVSVALSDYLDISNWKKQVFIRMSTLFVLTLILILTMVGIIFYLLNIIFREKQLVAMQADFANNINHELNTPLSSMAINIRNLRRADIYEQKPLYNQQIDLLQRQYLKLKYIVDQILEIDSGGHPEPQVRAVNIPDYLRSAVSLVNFQHHPFRSSIAPQAVIIQTDIHIVEKVIDQLLENAEKYAAPGTLVELNAYREGSNYIISVEDHGKGISKQHQELIFRRFYRIPAGNHHHIKGLGLGLFLARMTLGKINAQIEVKSGTEYGNKFIIKLPLK